MFTPERHPGEPHHTQRQDPVPSDRFLWRWQWGFQRCWGWGRNCLAPTDGLRRSRLRLCSFRQIRSHPHKPRARKSRPPDFDFFGFGRARNRRVAAIERRGSGERRGMGVSVETKQPAVMSADRAAPDAADRIRLWAATPSTHSLRSGSLRALRVTATRLGGRAPEAQRSEGEREAPSVIPAAVGSPAACPICTRQSPADLAVAWQRGRALLVKAPVAVAPTLAQKARPVGSQVPFQVATLHAMRMSSDSRSTPAPASYSAARRSSIPARASRIISRASSRVLP